MQFETSKRTIRVYSETGEKNTEILVILHEDHGEIQEVWEALQPETRAKITLAGVSGISWEHDLSPWEAPAAFKKAPAFTGGAEEYRKELCDEILPEIEQKCGHSFEVKYIAGYSLAGLFALYSAYQTDVFSGIVSASGSLWYPNFLAYTKSHEISKNIRTAYFSLGDKEAKTRNPVMQPVEDNTREIEERLRESGLWTIFELNPGGHFVDDAKRLAKGIDWIVRGEKE